MNQVTISGQGSVVVLDVPVPLRLPKSVLVRTAYSPISGGTARADARAGLLATRAALAATPPAGRSGDRARRKPDRRGVGR